MNAYINVSVYTPNEEVHFTASNACDMYQFISVLHQQFNPSEPGAWFKRHRSITGYVHT